MKKKKKEMILKNKKYIKIIKNQIKKKKLHKNKKLLINNGNGEKKWDGDIEKAKPRSIFMSKENYQTLKNKSAQNILEEIKAQEEDPTNTKDYLIETIIPEIADIKGSNTFYGKKHETPNLNQKKLHMKVHKLNLNKEENKSSDDTTNKKTKNVNLNKKDDEDSLKTDFTKEEIENQDNENDNNEANKNKKNEEKEEEKDDTRKYYSDSLELFNELSNKNDENEEKNNEDNLFGFGLSERYFKGKQSNNVKKLGDKTGIYNYSPETQYSCDENHSYYTSVNSSNNTNKTYNYYDNIYSSVSDNMKSNNNPKYNYNYLLVNNKYKDNPQRMKKMQNNWKYFSKEIKRVSGVYVLQTIGTILTLSKLNLIEKL